MFRLFFLLTSAIFLASFFGTSQSKSSNQSNGPITKTKSCEVVPHVGCCKDGKDGKDGKNGNDGRDGVNGKDGRDGRDGTSRGKGEKGEAGMPGRDGIPGIKGEKGEPGGNNGNVSIKGSSSSKSACCAPGFYFYEKFQDLPTQGAADVEHFTIDGRLFLAFANYYGDINKHKSSSTIYKMDESTGKLALYQTLQSRGPYDLEYFSIADKHFLAVANHQDGTYRLDSVIYQWNGKLFVVFQKIPTKGSGHFAFFKINGENYLAVANYHDDRTESIKSVIYKWSSGKFNKFQDISTEGALGCEAFVINNDSFVAFTNYYSSQQKYSVQSTVFKWSGGRFVKLQSLQTHGAFDVKFFDINGHTFLAFANFYSGSKHNIDSFIYKWDGNKFVLFQSIPTRGAIAWHPFVISGQTYLSVANHYGDSQKYSTQSVVYQASGARFIKYQEFPTQGARGMTSFEYKSHTYLAVTNYYNGQRYNINSVLYKWV